VKGVNRPKSGKEYTQEEILLMKTRDISYLQMKAQAEQKKVEQLKASLQFVDQARSNSHVYFAEDRADAKSISQRLAAEEPSTSRDLPRRIKKKQDAAYRELEERTERADKLKRMVVQMTLQKQAMGKGRKRKLPVQDGETQPVFKWAQERKK
jgi:U3 small nucleolar RNA-associated protein 11